MTSSSSIDTLPSPAAVERSAPGRVVASPDTALYLPLVARERTALRDRLTRAGLAVTAAADLKGAFEALATQPFTVCVLDLGHDRAALVAIRSLRVHHAHLPLVAVVDAANPVTAGELIQAGVTELLSWPFEDRDLGIVVANIRDRAVDVDATEMSEVSGHPLFAQSGAMRQVLERVRASSGSTGGVCLCGEPGTGRTLVARAIHSATFPQNGRPFVVVDCATESAVDLEERLFGVADRGMNGPGPVREVRVNRQSALASAHGGTLLVRNLVEAPARVQAKLARVLRDGEAMLGDRRSVMELHVRPMAAVDQTFEAALSDGRLRRELFGRLSHERIDVPPLRRRREDLPSLAAYFLRAEAAAQQAGAKSFSRAALRLLMALPWHGNAVELRELIATLVRSVSRQVIQIDDLLEHASLDGIAARIDTGVSLRDAKARFERECISAVLMRHHGRVAEAAKALGIQRTNLYRKVRQLNVARSLLSARR
jgi:DNA-binding NtrC family response regulator